MHRMIQPAGDQPLAYTTSKVAAGDGGENAAAQATASNHNGFKQAFISTCKSTYFSSTETFSFTCFLNLLSLVDALVGKKKLKDALSGVLDNVK